MTATISCSQRRGMGIAAGMVVVSSSASAARADLTDGKAPFRVEGPGELRSAAPVGFRSPVWVTTFPRARGVSSATSSSALAIARRDYFVHLSGVVPSVKK